MRNITNTSIKARYIFPVAFTDIFNVRGYIKKSVHNIPIINIQI